ncbi:MAG: lysine--tRNA ligase [Candidatus Micrarchaeia archaeon]
MADISESMIKGPRESEHWVSVLAAKITAAKRPPYVVASGITTSGPVHMGTACEFLYPNAVASFLQKEGHDVKFYFIGDIMDAFDAIPASMKNFEKILVHHLGKPLCYTPDPYDCCQSYGDHFLSQAKEMMQELDVHPTVIRGNQLYNDGKYDEYARFFLQNCSLARDVVFESSLRKATEEEKAMWNPIMPICENCGRIATTMVTDFDDNSYTYKDTRNVGYTSGCGYEGENKISDRKYKLIWRLEWPTRQKFLDVIVEGAGQDHWTKGGSVDTAIAVHKKLFERKPPFFFRFGLLLLKGKKFSKSKGVGVDVELLLQLMPAQVIKYYLYRYDAQENKDFDPSGQTLLRLYEDFEKTSELNPELASKMDRAERKKLVAYQLAGGMRQWKAKFLDALLYYQIYRDWNKVGSMLNDATGVKFLSSYIQYWLEQGYPPEEYKFVVQQGMPERPEFVRFFASRLKEDMSEVDVHNLVFDSAQEQGMEAADAFKDLYTSIIGKDKGPKLGKLIKAIGIGKVKDILSKV